MGLTSKISKPLNDSFFVNDINTRQLVSANWRYGVQLNAGNGYVGSNASESDPYSGCFQVWNTITGKKQITQLTTREAFAGSGRITEREFVVYGLDSDNVLTRISAKSLGVLGSDSTTSSTYDWTSEPLVFVIPEGYEQILIGVIYHRINGAAVNTPGFRAMSDVTNYDESKRFHLAASYAGDLNSIDLDLATASLADDAGPLVLEIEYTSFNPYMEAEIDSLFSGTESVHQIPVSRDGSTSIKLEDVTCDDTESQTIKLSTSDATVAQTIVHDMGATTAGVNVITMDGNDVTLPDWDDTVTPEGQDGDNFDYLIQQGTSVGDLLFLNKSQGMGPIAGSNKRDITTISHACANASARGSEYSFTESNFITVLGSGSVGKLQVCARPSIIFGDSQCGTKFSGDAYLNRLGLAYSTAR